MQKSTQTLVTELHDLMIEDSSNNQDAVLLILDQSKAYNIVSHEILLAKLKAIGFKSPALGLMSSYMEGRRQFVQLEGVRSEILATGPHSVIQGSTLSCILFLIFILDMPEIFHERRHTPAEQQKCCLPNLKTFVDDAYIKARREDDETFNQVIETNMKIITEYMKSNRMQLNPEKTTIMLQTKDSQIKKRLQDRNKWKDHQAHSKSRNSWQSHDRRPVMGLPGQQNIDPSTPE